MTLERKHAALSTDLDDPSVVPYFLWDEPMTVAELRAPRHCFPTGKNPPPGEDPSRGPRHRRLEVYLAG